MKSSIHFSIPFTSRTKRNHYFEFNIIMSIGLCEKTGKSNSFRIKWRTHIKTTSSTRIWRWICVDIYVTCTNCRINKLSLQLQTENTCSTLSPTYALAYSFKFSSICVLVANPYTFRYVSHLFPCRARDRSVFIVYLSVNNCEITHSVCCRLQSKKKKWRTDTREAQLGCV